MSTPIPSPTRVPDVLESSPDLLASAASMRRRATEARLIRETAQVFEAALEHVNREVHVAAAQGLDSILVDVPSAVALDVCDALYLRCYGYRNFGSGGGVDATTSLRVSW